MTVLLGTPRDWLSQTHQLDFGHPKIHFATLKLTQSRRGERERACAIHDFVRRLSFGALADFTHVRASEVLRHNRGDCHAKGVLFVALCRAAGIPARLNFVRIRPRFLHGILDEGPRTMAHAVGQARIDGQWVSTDGYVVDPVLFAQAKERLREEASDSGYGIVAGAGALWDGLTDNLQQFRPEDLIHDYGAYDDPHEFYDELSHDEGAPSWLTRWKYAMAAHMLNRRVRQLRRSLTGSQASLLG